MTPCPDGAVRHSRHAWMSHWPMVHWRWTGNQGLATAEVKQTLPRCPRAAAFRRLAFS